MKFTSERTSEIETRVLNALEPYGIFYKSKYKYSVYDLYGITGGDKTLIEIKEREKIWDEWYIDKSKIDSLLALREKATYKLRLYLFMVVSNECYIYNIDHVKKESIKELELPNNTSADFKQMKKKIKKKVYCFPFDLQLTKLII